MPLQTALDIVNASCAEIGFDPLQDLDQDTIGGEAASSIFETVTDFNLGMAPFSFGMEFRQLSKNTETPAFTGYAYQYDVPGEILGPPRWFTDDITDPDRRYTEFVLTAGKVLSSADPLFAFVKFRPDPHRWPPCFRKVTISGISAHLALALASDRALHDTILRRAYGTPSESFRGGEMKAALQEDAQATPPRKAAWHNNPFERSWRSG